MTIISAGSNWIKCDLHIHTPLSFFHHYGDRNKDEIWEKFLKDLEWLPPEFKMIGINDYLTIDGYKKVMEYKAKGRLANIDCILPVVEFRINKFAGEGKLKRINYHVIFDTTPDIIETQFLNALSAKYSLESGSGHPTWSGIISEASFSDLGKMIKELSPTNQTLQQKSDWRVGFDNFNVDYEDLKKILDRPQFKGKVITAIGKGEWEEFRWDAGGAADKRSIINEADLVFLSCESIESHAKGKKSLTDQKVNNVLIDCSDAHDYSCSTDKDRIGNCFTWLKIEASFDGLRQIVFEPEGRISISETHPDTKAPYQVISSAKFVNGAAHFTNAEIKFSPYLNSIIGGKSTGKSLLAGLIVKSSDPAEYKKRKAEQKGGDELDWIKVKEPAVDFQVMWKDGTATRLNDPASSRKITYFPQHYLNSKINDKGVGNKELNKIIRVILSQTPAYAEAFEEYETALKAFDAEIAADCSNLESKIRDVRQLKHTTQEKGKSADIVANIEKLNNEFSELKSQYGLSEAELTQHQTLGEENKALAAKKSWIEQNIKTMRAINKEEIKARLAPESFFADDFVQISDALKQKLSEKISPFVSQFAEEVDKILAAELELEKVNLAGVDKEIAEKSLLHAPILEKIKNSAPLHEKSTLIKQEQQKLEEVAALEARAAAQEKEVAELSAKLENYISKKLESAKIVTSKIEEQPFAKGDDELGIEILPKCKADHIQGILKDRIKYQSNVKIKNMISDDDFSDGNLTGYKNRVGEIIKQAIVGAVELKGDHKIAGVLQELLSNATYLNYDLKLGDDSFNIMSPGKRALALLRVLVELDTSQHPIILDQPEDDLDNRSIYEGLAKYIKLKKNRRQIIVVTHNPNVVVGSDSEFVIVANQSGQESNQDNRHFRFEYVYGGLENNFTKVDNPYVLEKQGIRQHVCEILDGGKDAFERREQLYTGSKKKIV